MLSTLLELGMRLPYPTPSTTCCGKDWNLKTQRNHGVMRSSFASEALAGMWGLPIVVPTCPRLIFAQGVRHKSIDIVTHCGPLLLSGTTTVFVLECIVAVYGRAGRRSFLLILIYHDHGRSTPAPPLGTTFALFYALLLLSLLMVSSSL